MSCPEKEPEHYEHRENKSIWILIALSLGAAVAVSWLLDVLAQGIPLRLVLPLLNRMATVSTVVQYVTVLIVGVYIGVVGLKELVIERRFSVEFLMAVAAFGAAYLGYMFEAASVLLLYSLAEYFETYIEDRARKTVERLSAFMPDKANVLTDGVEKTLATAEVPVGAVIIVRPGERIPLDGNVVDGISHVDQSLVTGESVPVPRQPGDCVYAGSSNVGGVLRIGVTKKAEDTLVSRIAKLVIESRKRKASIERLVDRFARVYVPVVIGLAAFTAVFMPTIAGGTLETWIYRSLILLVVSCPSAFIVSIPATLFTAITVAARKGSIVKGGIYIEKLAKVKTVILDKTGTLTLGVPTVHEVRGVMGAENEALLYAAALNQFSSHPVAKAIVKKALERKLDVSKMEVKDVEEFPGKGVVGFVNGRHVAVGNLELMKDHGCDCRKVDLYPENHKHTSVCVAIGKEGAAAVCVVDEVRMDALQAIGNLRKANINIAMLTGDKREIAEEVAQTLGVDNVHSELLPEDKVKIVEQTKSGEGLVAMAGDGVNDAPALAASDVGIAMGGVGVDVALESADVVLVNNELVQIPYLIKLSNKTMDVAKQNIAASIAVKILLGALGLVGLTPLWFTVASGDDGITMLLLLNTLRLTRVKL